MRPIPLRRLALVAAMFHLLAPLSADGAAKKPSPEVKVSHAAAKVAPTKSGKAVPAHPATRAKPAVPVKAAASKPQPVPASKPAKAVPPAPRPVVAQAPAPVPAPRPVAAPDPAPLDYPEPLSAVSPEPPPKKALPSRRRAPSPPVPVPSEADYLAEQEAWRAYQSSTARAWKSYQARTITREAYDAEVKRAWDDYQAVATDGSAASTVGRKEDALADLRTWMQLDLCNTNPPTSARQARGISGPASDSGPVFAGLLNRFVLTVAPEAARHIETDMQEYSRQSSGDIAARISRIQAGLGTRDMRRAYQGSWCDRP